MSEQVVEVRPSDGVAVVVSELLAPVIVIPLVTIIVSWHSSPSLLDGIAFAAVTGFFAAVLPYAALMLGLRRGRFADRNVRDRAQRPVLLAFTLGSVTLGLAILRGIGAPKDLFALMAAMVAGMAITLLVSTFWKISIHVACVAGVVASLALLIDGRAWWLSPLVGATAWSRMVLRHHSLAQVVAGAVAGAGTAAVALTLL